MARRAAKLYFLHGTRWGTGTGDSQVIDGTRIGEYKVHYADGTAETVLIVYGEDVRDWWDWDGSRPTSRGWPAWSGSTGSSRKANRTVRLYVTAWGNPHPEKPVATIDFISANTTAAAPLCVAITAGGKTGSELFFKGRDASTSGFPPETRSDPWYTVLFDFSSTPALQVEGDF